MHIYLSLLSLSLTPLSPSPLSHPSLSLPPPSFSPLSLSLFIVLLITMAGGFWAPVTTECTDKSLYPFFPSRKYIYIYIIYIYVNLMI